MLTIIRRLTIIRLFIAPSIMLCMESALHIRTSDEQEYRVPLSVAQVSETLKNMLEDIPAESEAAIPLPNISSAQFNLLLPAMQALAQFHTEEPEAHKKRIARQLKNIVTNLKSNEEPLSCKQLIEFIAGANSLAVPLVDYALEKLSHQVVTKDEWVHLDLLADKLKDLWRRHPALKMCAFRHHDVIGVRALKNGNFVSWSFNEDTIKVWNANNLEAEPITLLHQGVVGVIENVDGRIISWSTTEGTVKIWDINNLQAEPTTLQQKKVINVTICKNGDLIFLICGQNKIKRVDKSLKRLTALPHPGLWGIIESSNGTLISWSRASRNDASRIKVWDINNPQTEPTSIDYIGSSKVIESKNNKLIFWSGGSIRIIDLNNIQAPPITLLHRHVNGVIISSNGHNLISWSESEGSIKVWDFHTFQQLRALRHEEVSGVFDSSDSTFISWSFIKGTMKVWDNSYQEIITHQRLGGILDIVENSDGNLISYSSQSGTIRIWSKALLNPTHEQIYLLLAIYFESKGEKFELASAQELADYKAIFNAFTPTVQRILAAKAPNLIAAIQKA